MTDAAPTAAAADETLDDLRLRLAPAIADAAVFDGWSNAALANAARDCGVDPALAEFAFRDGQMAMLTAWIDHVDRAMVAALPDAALKVMSIRQRIRAIVLARLDAVAGREEALSRALAIMALPGNIAASTRLGWRSADRMWRLAGDTATDYNHYTKRAILAGIYAATLRVFATDRSEGKAETAAFLDRRIDGIMRFEKAKSQLLRPPEHHFSLTRLLGRIRYPAR